MILTGSRAVDKYIGRFFTNYDFAYVGEQFSDAFKRWNDLFAKDILNAYKTLSTSYTGRVSTIKSSFYRFPNGTILMYISSIVFNPIATMHVMQQSHAERVSKGMPSTPPPLVASTRRFSDYSYYDTGGTYYGHTIDIVKKKTSSKRKPQFNYYDRNTRAIMFDYDFYSPFPFEENEADAWATDGHKYRLPFMTLIETRKRLDNIITETINNYLRNNLLIA